MQSIIIKPPETSARTKEFARELNIPDFVAELLRRLEIEDKEDARDFFLAPEKLLLDAFQLKDFQKVFDKLVELHGSGQRILIHGDYDVDGISGTSLLFRSLKDLGYNVTWYLPDRFEDGYGLNQKNIRKFHEQGVNWVMTVDTGITAVEEIALANELGMNVIILDHHQEGEVVPNAFGILNPHQKDCEYPNKFLCGVGVAFKLMNALRRHFNPNTSIKYWEYVVLGTLADIMPVTGENRVLVKNGLKIIGESELPGIRALIRYSDLEGKSITGRDVLFKITPVLNAAGRMSKPDNALKLLVSETANEANEYLNILKKNCESRKFWDKKVSDEAFEMVKKEKFEDSKVLVLASREWHKGVIGITAAKLMEEYNRPVSVLSIDEDGTAVASARTVEGFNWHTALSESTEFLGRWGGHYYAAGFSIEEEKIGAFREHVNQIAENIEFAFKSVKDTQTDIKVDFVEITPDFMGWLQRFEPFGPSNELPVFYADKIKILYQKVVGGSHLKLKVMQENIQLEGIAFGLGALAEELNSHDYYNIAFAPSWNYFRGVKTIQLQVKAIERGEK